MRVLTYLWSKAVVTAILILTASPSARCQGRGLLNMANRLYKDKDYSSAAQYYEKFLSDPQSDKSDENPFSVLKLEKGHTRSWNSRSGAIVHLADCYRNCHDYTRAEIWYAKAVQCSPVPDVLAEYWYGVILRSNGKYAEASEMLTRFQQHYNKMDSFLRGADLEARNIRFILSEQHRSVTDSFSFSHLQVPGMNATSAAALWSGDSIVFTGVTDRRDGAYGSGTPFKSRLFTGTGRLGPVEGIKYLREGIPEEKHEGLATLSKDGNRMFLTRWNDSPGGGNAAIYESLRTDSGWSEPQELAAVNKKGYSSAQPFLVESIDGFYLLFTSNRPEGIGNYDLWMARLDSGYNVLAVENMGRTINSPGDDECPYFHGVSRTLAFSSNGRPGMGGFDVFFARGEIGFSKWERPVNAGIAFNSPRDDLYFVSSDDVNCTNTGWLTSDRESDCCLSLYSFRELNEQVVRGRVVDCRTLHPLDGVRMAFDRSDRNESLTTVTDSGGRYQVILHNCSGIGISAVKYGYEEASKRYAFRFRSVLDTFVNEDICLIAAKQDTSADSRAGLIGGFAYKEYRLTPACKKKLDSLSKIMLDSSSLVLRIDGYTDGVGSEAYNLKLAEKRVNACIGYLNSKGIDRSRLVGRPMGKCCPLFPETVGGKDDPRAREKNRRVGYVLLKG